MTAPKSIKVTFTNLLDGNENPIKVEMPYPTPELINKLIKDKSIPADIKQFRQSVYLNFLAEELALAKRHK